MVIILIFTWFNLRIDKRSPGGAAHLNTCIHKYGVYILWEGIFFPILWYMPHFNLFFHFCFLNIDISVTLFVIFLYLNFTFHKIRTRTKIKNLRHSSLHLYLMNTCCKSEWFQMLLKNHIFIFPEHYFSDFLMLFNIIYMTR